MDKLFCVSKTIEGLNLYHVYGLLNHPKYQEFYKWFNKNIKHYYDYTDFPHHYFVIEMISDEQKFKEIFGDYIEDDINNEQRTLAGMKYIG